MVKVSIFSYQILKNSRMIPVARAHLMMMAPRFPLRFRLMGFCLLCSGFLLVTCVPCLPYIIQNQSGDSRLGQECFVIGQSSVRDSRAVFFLSNTEEFTPHRPSRMPPGRSIPKDSIWKWTRGAFCSIWLPELRIARILAHLGVWFSVG